MSAIQVLRYHVFVMSRFAIAPKVGFAGNIVYGE
jgi:hypothetical protein